MSWLWILIIFAVTEIVLLSLVHYYRKEFQWLITTEDEVPELDKNGLDKFFNSSYDPQLGWVRKPNTVGFEKSRRGDITFHIDEYGSRANPENGGDPYIAAFGDSYVFCRQVEDHQTWEVQLSKKTGYNVLNFGVGNYGADQALLRYQQTKLPKTVRVAILGFVPETLCRVHSQWKHYLEFGNTFAFKPKYHLKSDGELLLLENPMKNPDDFERLEEIIPKVVEWDRFYLRKFKSLQFRFPYTVSFLRHPIRHGSLLGSLILRSLFQMTGITTSKIRNLPFRLVMKYNIRESHRLYCESEFTSLLLNILIKFRDEAKKRGHYPLVLVMPQLLDLELNEKRDNTYKSFFRDVAEKDLSVIDMTPIFKKRKNSELYIDDQYGGHLSEKGNQIVSESIEKWLNSKQLINPEIEN